MRIGYLLDLNVGGYDQPVPSRERAADVLEALIEEARLAERAGFHSVAISDRHGRTEVYAPGPMQLLTVLARETERVAIGSFNLVLTLYHPMLVAEQTAVADLLSRGRFFHTLGRGYHEGYWDSFGIPKERLLGRFQEGLRIYRRALEQPGVPFSFDGEHYQVRDAYVSPGPWQSHVPVWGSGQVAAAIERCGVYADAWGCDPFPIDRATWDEQAGAYRRKAEQHGRRPFIAMMRDGWVADSFEQGMAEFGTYYLDEMRFYARHGIVQHFPGLEDPSALTPESTRDSIVVGSRDQVIERLDWFSRELGVDYFLLRFRMTNGPSLEAAREQIQRFGEEVVSYFHARDPAIDHPAIPEGARW